MNLQSTKNETIKSDVGDYLALPVEPVTKNLLLYTISFNITQLPIIRYDKLPINLQEQFLSFCYNYFDTYLPGDYYPPEFVTLQDLINNTLYLREHVQEVNFGPISITNQIAFLNYILDYYQRNL